MSDERVIGGRWIRPASIFARDGYRCTYCASRPVAFRSSFGFVTGDLLYLDHAIPKSRGGTELAGNLVAVCAPCNLSKGNRRRDDEALVLQRAAARTLSVGLEPNMAVAKQGRVHSWVVGSIHHWACGLVVAA